MTFSYLQVVAFCRLQVLSFWTQGRAFFKSVSDFKYLMEAANIRVKLLNQPIARSTIRRLCMQGTVMHCAQAWQEVAGSPERKCGVLVAALPTLLRTPHTLVPKSLWRTFPCTTQLAVTKTLLTHDFVMTSDLESSDLAQPCDT